MSVENALWFELPDGQLIHLRPKKWDRIRIDTTAARRRVFSDDEPERYDVVVTGSNIWYNVLFSTSDKAEAERVKNAIGGQLLAKKLIHS